MPAVGGSVESVTINGRLYAVAADAEGQRKLGGKENEVQPNGNGTARLVQVPVTWSVEGLTLEVDDSRGDDEELQAQSNRPDFFPIAFTFASGIVYSGTGQMTGDGSTSSMATTKAVNFSGPGKLTPQ